ncbi:hypothetical protein [Paenibacillus sp. OV219]|uniref:hypothetical protein n=1 Tax=Paenibacillus sp. OV219 TaxID=1884377 RepID=UPI0008C0CAB2|nr:hypothetical protein [Paenibacillus sp. OV219]SEO13685.1 hypothetical protein SAMN05518847_10642 [Paenibacillus sp. OV219]
MQRFKVPHIVSKEEIGIEPIELLTAFDLHDSIVESVEYLLNENKVLIKLELCRWKQANFDEFESEMQEGVLTFTDVDSFQIEPPSFLLNSNEVLDIKVHHESRSIEIILTGTDDVGKVSVIAKDIFWEEC